MMAQKGRGIDHARVIDVPPCWGTSHGATIVPRPSPRPFQRFEEGPRLRGTASARSTCEVHDDHNLVRAEPRVAAAWRLLLRYARHPRRNRHDTSREGAVEW